MLNCIALTSQLTRLYTYLYVDTEIYFYQIMLVFHRAFVTNVACQHDMLTLPDTWLRPFWGFAYTLLVEIIFPKAQREFSEFSLRKSLGTFTILHMLRMYLCYKSMITFLWKQFLNLRYKMHDIMHDRIHDAWLSIWLKYAYDAWQNMVEMVPPWGSRR